MLLARSHVARLLTLGLGILGGCFVGGSGSGVKGGKGSGGTASGTVMIGGTLLNQQVHVAAPELPPCRKELERLGVPYSQASFLTQVQNNNEPAARLFLDCGMPVDARDADKGMTALAFAAAGGAVEVTRLLIERGADVKGRARRDTASTPLMAAVTKRNSDIALLLLAKGADATVTVGGESALAIAAGNGDAAMIAALVKAGADARGPQGGLGLRRAAAAGQLDAVQALASAGADLNAADDAGDTPLMFAARKEQIAVGCFLLKAGADPRRRNKAGYDAFEGTDLSAASFQRQYCRK